MESTRRRFIQSTSVAALAAAVETRRAWCDEQSTEKKRALAVLGDAWHCVAPLYTNIVGTLKTRGYAPTTIIDYAVPFDALGQYDLIVLSRYAYDDVTHFRERDQKPAGRQRALWLSSEEEQRFEDYVAAGGRLLLHHDGFGFYPREGAISRLARAFFIRHPPIVEIEVRPTGKVPELTQGITPFTVADEEYQVEMDETQTSVFLESHSPQNGRSPQGWAHDCGQGRVVVFVPGHSENVLVHPMVKRSLENVIDWLGK